MKVLLASILVATVLPLQPGVPVAADPAEQLKPKLQELVRAQENYWAGHGTYTTDVAALGMYQRGAPDSVWVQVVQAGGRSWWGQAAHRGYRGKSCVIFVGKSEDFSTRPTTDGGAQVKAQKEGDPTCDRF